MDQNLWLMLNQQDFFSKDKILLENKCETIYWKTGHSHIKRKVNVERALAAFRRN